MDLPFTTQEFLNVFASYNQTVFPIQVILFLLALFALYFSFKKRSWSDKAISAILSLLWLWMGAIYHILFFSSINNSAYLFGILFIVQGALLIWTGVLNDKLKFHLRRNISCFTGMSLIIFALFIYPAVGHSLGHVYPSNPTFGLPCPTTIFTFGMFLLVEKKFPLLVLIVPIVWAVIGFSAAFLLGIKEDISLLIAAMITLGIILTERKKT